MDTLSQGSQKALVWSAPNPIRLVDLAIAGVGLDSPVCLFAPAALGFRISRRGQPTDSVSICRVPVLEGSPH